MQYGRTNEKKPKAHSAQEQASMLGRTRAELTPYLARYKTAERAARMRHKHLALLLQIIQGLTSLWKRGEKKGGAKRAVEAAAVVAPKASRRGPYVPEEIVLAMNFHGQPEEKRRGVPAMVRRPLGQLCLHTRVHERRPDLVWVAPKVGMTGADEAAMRAIFGPVVLEAAEWKFCAKNLSLSDLT